MEKARFLRGSILLIFPFHNRQKSIAFVNDVYPLVEESAAGDNKKS